MPWQNVEMVMVINSFFIPSFTNPYPVYADILGRGGGGGANLGNFKKRVGECSCKQCRGSLVMLWGEGGGEIATPLPPPPILFLLGRGKYEGRKRESRKGDGG